MRWLIYCIGEEGTPYNKLGFTKNLETLKRRLRALQCGNHRVLVVKWYFWSRTKDYVIHRHLIRAGKAKIREKGEWFYMGRNALQSFLRNKRPTIVFHSYNPA